METTINSRKLGYPVTFYAPSSGGYVFVDLNGKSGTLGQQICAGGDVNCGSTLSYSGDPDNFGDFCRRWFASYLRDVEFI